MDKNGNVRKKKEKTSGVNSETEMIRRERKSLYYQESERCFKKCKFSSVNSKRRKELNKCGDNRRAENVGDFVKYIA